MRKTEALWVIAFAALVMACGDGSTLEDGGPDGAAGADTGTSGDLDGTVAGCGDGMRTRDEVCDDGNRVDGDGCSADCQSDETCGNETLDVAVGELCDDGNTSDGDECRGDCRSDYRCGNGVLDSTTEGAPVDEACDDGNTVNGDGCSASCDSDESCGNGIVDLGAGEVCDDGNTTDGDDCSADCSTSTLCGNGTLDAAEECDDGNLTDGDGCSASCLTERCGNGRVDAGEECDDGNIEDTDGCTVACSFTCRVDGDCGDGDICNGAEVCTDGASTASRCAAAPAPAPDGTACGSALICLAGSCAASACGDGFVDTSEDCDDGNTAADDGCENDCTFTCGTDADCSDGNACSGTETCTNGGTASSACALGTPSPTAPLVGRGESVEAACAPWPAAAMGSSRAPRIATTAMRPGATAARVTAPGPVARAVTAATATPATESKPASRPGPWRAVAWQVRRLPMAPLAALGRSVWRVAAWRLAVATRSSPRPSSVTTATARTVMAARTAVAGRARGPATARMATPATAPRRAPRRAPS